MRRHQIVVFSAWCVFWLALQGGCAAAGIRLYDEFDGDVLRTDLWQERVTGSDSSLELKGGTLLATAVNDPAGESGRAGLNFADPGFQAFQADVRIVAYEGQEKTRVRLEGLAYGANGATGQSRQGDVAIFLHLKTTGQVGYLIELCADPDCRSRTTAAAGKFATVNADEQHTLAMGLRGGEAYFRVDDEKTVTVHVAGDLSLGTSRWRYAGIRARSTEATERITAEIDNVRTGTVVQIFGP